MIGSEEKAGQGVQTLHRGLDLLEQVVRRPMRMSELAERSGLSRRTTMRLATALADRSFLARGTDGQLRAGARLLRLGVLAQERHDLVSVARPHLMELSAAAGLSCFLGRRDGDDSVHLYRAQGRERLMVATPVGTRRKLMETSMGKALVLDEPLDAWRRLMEAADASYRLPGWEEAMQADGARGAVIHHGPPPDLLCAAAAPIRDCTGRIVGAVSVPTLAQHMNAASLNALAVQVRDAAAAISGSLGYAPSDREG